MVASKPCERADPRRAEIHMPRKATGNAVRHGDRWYARIAVAPKKRPAIHLETCGPEDGQQARERASLMADVIGELRRAGRDDFVPTALKRLATLSGAKLAAFVTLTRGYAAGTEALASDHSPADRTTFRKFAERWTGGDLARQYPAHVKIKRTVDDDVCRLEKWVYPAIEDLPLSQVGLDQYEAILRAVTGSQATRRHVAQIIRRVLQLAVYPARLLATNPIPRGALPKKGTARAFPYLYPAEDRALLACREIPLVYRVLYGFLAREGPRAREALVLKWEQLDIKRGTVSVEENKTDDFRTRPLDPGVSAALRAWKASIKPKESDHVFLDNGQPLNGDRLAEHFRTHLKRAKVDRRELFIDSEKRGQIRAHDLRATFVTISLAAGKTEAWVTDRTGHRSSEQLTHYRRAARTAGELGHTSLDPLNDAIPELRGKGRRPGSAGSKGGPGDAKRTRVHSKRARIRRLAARRRRLAVFRFHRREA
jgi:integrase